MGTAESSRRLRAPSSENIGTLVPKSFERRRPGTIVLRPPALSKSFGKSKFGAVACALWPDDTPARVAKAVRCTKRHANLLIEGKRKPNARAALALLSEIIS